MPHRSLRPFCLSLLALTFYHVAAQQPQRWDDYAEQTLQNENVDAPTWEDMQELLNELTQHPLDLNRATRTELEQLPMLSTQQVMEIMEHRDRYKRFESVAELMLLPSMDWQTRQWLEPLLYVGAPSPTDTLPSLQHLMRHARHEVVGTLHIPLYERAGDKNGYTGWPYKHWLRYTLTATSRVKVGLLAAQDAGEPFFSRDNATGWDFYSGYIMVKQLGMIRAAVLGRYRLRFALGLTMNTSFGLGKQAALTSLGRTSTGIFGHASRSESTYLQGAAATLYLGHGWSITPFVSWRKIDATLRSDTMGIATLLTSGYHRTPSELARRRNASQTLLGTHAEWRKGGWHAGTTAHYTWMSQPLLPLRKQRYKRWYPEGKQFWAASVDYGFTSHRFTVEGETATASTGGLATLHTLNLRANSQLWLVLLHRFYAYQYHSFFAESFSESGHVQNESGLYLGARWTPRLGMAFSAYTDLSYAAWDTYLARAGSHTWDNQLQAELERGKWLWQARYRLKMRERNNTEHSALEWRTEQYARLAATLQVGAWQLRSQIDGTHVRQQETHWGWMVSQSVSTRWRWVQASLGMAYFDANDYDARLYTYERGLLYTLSFPSFFGRGVHTALRLRADVSSRWMLIAKISATHYFDRSTIGTGLQRIDHSTKSDVELQCRWKF